MVAKTSKSFFIRYLLSFTHHCYPKNYRLDAADHLLPEKSLTVEVQTGKIQ